VAHKYVVCTQDRVVPEALQRRFVREIDAVSAKPTRVVELRASHSPFLSRPAELADVIAAVAQGAMGEGRFGGIQPQ
jgi:pimeloyl-ACP methyl ester carboxylesterase